jgi:hypothetical protein
MVTKGYLDTIGARPGIHGSYRAQLRDTGEVGPRVEPEGDKSEGDKRMTGQGDKRVTSQGDKPG